MSNVQIMILCAVILAIVAYAVWWYCKEPRIKPPCGCGCKECAEKAAQTVTEQTVTEQTTTQ